MIEQRMEFFLKFVTQPTKIGSITPSSSFLTREMLEKLPWDNINTLVELGAGTGVFTNYIAEKKKSDCRVLVFEQSEEMNMSLKERHPDFFYAQKAQHLLAEMAEYNLPKADCIVSGLPFTIIPEKICDEIMQGVYDGLSDDGVFVAFQYSPYMYGRLKRYFNHVETGFVLLNMPPAFVYKCRK